MFGTTGMLKTESISSKNTAKKIIRDTISEFKDIQGQKLKKQHFPALSRTFQDI